MDETKEPTMKDWVPTFENTGAPRYVEIAEAIRRDVASGALRPGDRLPPQRGLAQEIGLDYSTISRAYAEAVRRGYIESHVGRGSFVKALDVAAPDPRRLAEEDPMMNMPPEPTDPHLIGRMQQGVSHVSANLISLLRYQSVMGGAHDREIAIDWMQSNGLPAQSDCVAITSGAHSSLYAILSLMSDPGLPLLCEDVTYPGIRAIAARLGVRLIGVKTDEHGMLPDALETAIRENWPMGLYLNPTFNNPTTTTIPLERRVALAEVLQRHDLPLIEDDAYAFVASNAPPAIATLIPEQTWHIAGVSKIFGAGLRLAYTTAPKPELIGAFSQALRAINVMASPISLALLGHWIEEGVAVEIQGFVRKEATARQVLARETLTDCVFQGDDEAYNIWLTLPEGTSRAEIMARMGSRQIGLMPSDAFTVAGPIQDAIRVCLGGPIEQSALRSDLIALNDAVARKDWLG